MKLKIIIAMLACRLSHFAIRLLRRGGTAMPGRIALKLCPELLSYLSRGVRTVVITGTNGKTTTSRMVEEAFSMAGLDYIANRSGANLISGITTAFALESSLTGKCRRHWAVIECDEAAARKTLGQLKPQAVVVTNLFRDQLDRYGEVTHTLENIREGLRAVPGAVLCLNADCSLTASLSRELPNRTVFFGIDKGAGREGHPGLLSDAAHCLFCGGEYSYDYVTYGHLGGFRCPRCGWSRPDTQVKVTQIKSLDSTGSTVTMDIRGSSRDVRVNLPAMYNIYNAAAAVCAASEMGLSADMAADAVGSFRCGFGRMEEFDLGAKGARMMLVKNPAGCNQVLEFLCALSEPMELAVCLNDNGADGTDVSWIWDADFELLAGLGPRLSHISVSGIRASDMWLRLKYAGIPEEKLSLERDYAALTEKLSKAADPVYIIPTYTAMLELRSCMVKRLGGREFWEG